MYFQPARILFKMNINRLITVSILAIVSFVLFIYPAPEGIFYDILGVIVFVLIIAILFQFSTSEPDSTELEENENHEESTSVNQNLIIHEDLQDQYEQLLNIVFNMISAINENYKAAFYMFDGTGQNLNIQFSRSEIFKNTLKINNNILQTILNQNEAVLLQQSDVREDWNELFVEKTWRGSECVFGSRVLYKNSPVGCLIIQTDHFSNIHERDRVMLTSLGHFVSMGMVKLDNIEKLSLDNYFHYQIANLLNSLDIQSEVRGLYEKVRDLCRTFFSYDKLTIAELQNDGENFKVVMEDGFKGDVDQEKLYSITGNIFGKIFQTKNIIESTNLIEDFYEKGRFEDGDLENYEFKSMLSVPVLINKSVKYSITLEKQQSQVFSISDKTLLELLALTFGSIISWQQQYWSMRDNAMHDGLTSLLNHKAFLDRFDEEISRANRYNHNIVFAILDLDKFKRINDTYGHLYGDYVIREVARIIKENVRNIDVVGRYGGEEYSILMINTTVEKIIAVAQRIIEMIAVFPFNFDNINVRMTISCGLAEYPNDGMNMNDLITKADEAMYDAKKQGGNLVVVYEKIMDHTAGIESNS